MNRRENPPADEHARVETLLGVWALDACSEEEAADVEAHLPRCDDCTAEAVVLRAAAAAFGPEEPPPPALYPRIVADAFAKRPPAPEAPAYAAPYAAQVAMLDALLDDVDGDEWSTVIVEGWTVQQLVAHLTATDSLIAGQLGIERPGGAPGDGVPERTAALVEQALRQPVEETRRVWRTQAEEICRALLDGGNDLAGDPVSLGPMMLSVADMVTGRAFETWIHTADIARCLDRPFPPPPPEHLHRIADLGARLLPMAMRLAGTPLDDRTLRLVLEGPGGGHWLLGAGQDRPETTPDAEVHVDVVEFCFLAGGRREPDRVAAGLSGDRELVRLALAAAPAFSGP